MAFFKFFYYSIGFITLPLSCLSTSMASETNALDRSIIAAGALEFVDRPLLNIGLKCPADNSGIMQHLKRNSDGVTIRNRYKFLGSKISKLIIDVAKPGESFNIIYAIDVDKEIMTSKSEIFRHEVEDGMRIYNQICLTPDARARFKAQAEDNLRDLTSIGASEIEPSRKRPAPSAWESFRKSNDPLKTVLLKCPSSNFGIIEFWRANGEGIISRIKGNIYKGKLLSAIVEVAAPHGWFEEIERLSKPFGSEEKRARLAKVEKDLTELLTKVCADQAQLANFTALARLNRDKFPRPTPFGIAIE